jgi:hypothetical protein
MHYQQQTNTKIHGESLLSLTAHGATPVAQVAWLVTYKSGDSASSRKRSTLYFTVDGSYTLTLHNFKE